MQPLNISLILFSFEFPPTKALRGVVIPYRAFLINFEPSECGRGLVPRLTDLRARFKPQQNRKGCGCGRIVPKCSEKVTQLSSGKCVTRYQMRTGRAGVPWLHYALSVTILIYLAALLDKKAQLLYNFVSEVPFLFALVGWECFVNTWMRDRCCTLYAYNNFTPKIWAAMARWLIIYWWRDYRGLFCNLVIKDIESCGYWWLFTAQSHSVWPWNTLSALRLFWTQ